MILQMIKNRNFSMFLLGESLALFGYYALQLAISLYLLDITQSAAKFASAFMVHTAPTLVFGIMAGVVVDKVDRKKFLIILDLIRSVILAFTFMIMLTGSLTEVGIYILLLFLGTCNVFFTPAFVTVLPSILKKEELVEGNSVKNTVLEGTKIAAPVVGALLYGVFGLGAVLCLSSSLFLLSALCLKSLSFESIERKQVKQSILSDLREGFSVFQDVRLSSLVLNGFLTHLFLTAIFMMGFPFIIKEVFNGSDMDIGIIESIATIGIVTSIFAIGAVKNKISLAQGIFYGIIGMIITVIPLFLLANIDFLGFLRRDAVYHLIFFSIVTFGMFWVRGFYGAFFVAFYQREVTQDKLGRFFSVMSIFFSLGQLIGFKLYGYLLDSHSLLVSIIILGFGMILKAIVHIPFMIKDKQMDTRVVHKQII